MKRLLGSIAISLLFTVPLLGADVTVYSQGYYNVDPQILVDSLIDYKNICNRGCKYQVKGLEETRVLEDTGDSQVIWQKVNDLRNVQQYVFNWIEESGDTITYNSVIPDRQHLIYLKNTHGLPHNTALDHMHLTWTFASVGNGAVRADGKMFVKHSYPAFLNGAVRIKIQETIDSLKRNFDIAVGRQ